MIAFPASVRVWLTVGGTDMRRGMTGLALQVQEALGHDPHAGDLYVFRGARGDLIKVLWHDGIGMSLCAKRLEKGRFVWPSPADGVVGVSASQLAYTTQRNQEARPAPDLVDRKFTAPGPDQLWVADITYVPTATGFLYLAMVLDAWSRKIVGWSMANHLRAELVLAAMEMAIGQRRPKEVIHHSDQGSQLGFNQSSQRPSQLTVSVRQMPRPVFSSQGFYEVSC